MKLFSVLLGIACTAEQGGPPPPGKVSESLQPAAAVLSEKRAKARHVLVSHKDALRSPEELRRTRQEAELRAERVLEEALAGADFSKLASIYSDGPTANRGGELGVFGRGTMSKPFEVAVFGMQAGELVMVETEFGYHVVERLPLDEIRIVHIVIQWEDGIRSEAARSKEEARELSTMVYQLLGEGMPASDAARRYSDGPYGSRGGDAGWFERGQLHPELEKAGFALAEDEYSEVVETQMGFHLLYRSE